MSHQITSRPTSRFKDWAAIDNDLYAAESLDEGAARVVPESGCTFEATVKGAYVQSELRRGEHFNLVSWLSIKKLIWMHFLPPRTVPVMQYGIAQYFSFLRMQKLVGGEVTKVDPVTIFRISRVLTLVSRFVRQYIQTSKYPLLLFLYSRKV